LENESSNRRRFIQKILGLTAAGALAGFLQQKTGLPSVEAADGDPLIIGQVNTGSGTTWLTSSGNVAFIATSTELGVLGQSTASSGTTIGVRGYSPSTSGIGVRGEAGNAGAKPIVARGWSGQTANLQEWQDFFGTSLSVVDASGKLGVGTSTPAASIHGETGLSYPAIRGRNSGTGDGIRGESSGGYGVIGTTAASSKAGMYGYGSGSAIGVRAKSVSGFALFVDGKNYFKSAQRGTIPSGVSSYVVTVPAGITIRTAAMIFVTLMSPPNVFVKWVQRLSDTQFKIWLTGTTTGSIAFGYFIVN